VISIEFKKIKTNILPLTDIGIAKNNVNDMRPKYKKLLMGILWKFWFTVCDKYANKG